MTVGPDQSGSTECVWCGYDTAAAGATRCAECGASLRDSASQRLSQLLECKDWLAIGLWGTVLVSFIFTVLWLSLHQNNLWTVLVLSAFYLAALAWGVVKSFHTWRDLHQSGFVYPQRWIVLGLGLMYLIQFLGLGFVQVMGMLAVWRAYF